MMTFLNKIYLFDNLGDKDGKANSETYEGEGKDYENKIWLHVFLFNYLII